MQMMSIGLVVTELCCHKINMNTKEKHIIRSILNEGPLRSCCSSDINLVTQFLSEDREFIQITFELRWSFRVFPMCQYSYDLSGCHRPYDLDGQSFGEAIYLSKTYAYMSTEHSSG